MQNHLTTMVESLQTLLNLPDSMPRESQEVAQQVQGLLVNHSLQLSHQPAEMSLPGLSCVAPQIASLTGYWQTLGIELLALESALPWVQRPEPDYPNFMAGHANAQIIGPKGLVHSETVMIGVSFLQAGITYPNHQHPPAEVYLILTQGQWRQQADPWHTPGPASYVYNQSNIVHAMRSLDKPLLAIWCLPLT